jgi:hypothetical protein
MNFKTPDDYLRDVLKQVEGVTDNTKTNSAHGEAESTSPGAADEVIHLEDFVAYLPKHNYIFLPTREPWPGTSVIARIKPVEDGGELIAASTWLDKHRPVEQMTWCPGLELLIQDRLIAEGGWIERPARRSICIARRAYRSAIPH